MVWTLAGSSMSFVQDERPRMVSPGFFNLALRATEVASDHVLVFADAAFRI